VPPAAPAGGARDGRDYGACAGGDCEVLVTDPVSFPVTGETLSLGRPGDDGDVQVTFSDQRGNTTSVSVSPGCAYRARFSEGGGSDIHGCLSGADPDGDPGDLLVQVVRSTPGGIVLRLHRS
jgi:hypothetical protein